MKRIFELKWADEMGETWMNKGNLKKLLRTEAFVDSRIQFEIEDITDAAPKAAKEVVPKSEETKSKMAKPVKSAEPAEKEVGNRVPCRFKVSSKCHRFPPKIVGEGKQYLNPGVQEGCWCGEFQPIVSDSKE